MSKVLLRWFASSWCNYQCAYCDQDHARKQVYKGEVGHWIDKAPVQDWIAAFDKHFAGSELTLTVTGGEPFLEKSLGVLLKHLQNAPYCEAFHVDTNGSIPLPEPMSKGSVMVSYHPSQTDDAAFFRKLNSLNGWNVTTVNIVAVPGQFDAVHVIREKSPYPVNVLPMDGRLDHYSADEQRILRTMIPEHDWYNRTSQSTRGMLCEFPELAYEMKPGGQLRVGCHPHLSGRIWDDELPARFKELTPCPDEACFCIEKYSHLYDVQDVPQRALSARIRLL
jgi:organic radical activating enzyme